MEVADIISIIIILLIVGGAALYIYRQKRKGVKCIGCPYAKQCSGGCCGSGSSAPAYKSQPDAKCHSDKEKPTSNCHCNDKETEEKKSCCCGKKAEKINTSEENEKSCCCGKKD